MRALHRRLCRSIATLKRLPRDDRGVSAIEFALIAPILMILMLGMFDYAMLISRKMELVSAVRSGAQYALINSTATNDIAQTVINSTNLPSDTLTVNVANFCECSNGTTLTCGNSCTLGGVRYYTKVTGSYAYTPIFLPGPITLSETTTIRTQ